jgi:hypothetical protein
MDVEKKKKTSSKTKRPKTISPDSPLPEAWEQQIVEIVRAEMQSLMETKRPQTVELPPPREKVKGPKGLPVGRGERVKVGVTLDKVIADRFEAEHKRLGLSASMLIETILWHWFNRPILSFQKPDE